MLHIVMKEKNGIMSRLLSWCFEDCRMVMIHNINLYIVLKRWVVYARLCFERQLVIRRLVAKKFSISDMILRIRATIHM